ncbi:MAG: multifunctional CCA addition/repair protein [Succinimonas sp.]|nr:multifunctional CCA addition/repair protein [Succinimonas sp.]
MRIYLVGGAVRDRLLGIKSKDRDYCVEGARPEDLLSLGYKQVGHDFPVFLHPETGEEYALCRTERKSGHGYNGFVCDFSPDISIAADLKRRDLTINAIAEDEAGNLVDPLNGVRDIREKILRHAGPAFTEDPLRVLRLARFYARFYERGFTVAPETEKLCSEMAASGELLSLTPERVWRETEKALNTNNPEQYFIFLEKTGALKCIMPDLARLREIPEPEGFHPEKDVFAHTMLALREISRITGNPVTRFAMVTHDFGKLETPPECWPAHEKHTEKGAPRIKALAQALKIPAVFRDFAIKISENHSYSRITAKDPEILDRVFSRMGGYKDPHNISVLAECLTADFRGRGKETQKYFTASYDLVYIFARACKITAAPVIQDGFQGAAIQAELSKRRQEAIKTAQDELIRLWEKLGISEELY